MTPFPVRALPWVLTGGGAVGLVASFVLTVEKIALLADADYVPTCSINPVLSCGSIMRTPQAEVLGFPNPLLGVVGFTVVLTTGVVVLAGARLPHWYWLGLQVGSALGVLFIHWLAFQSLYEIGALCPYCMVVWVVTVPVFWYTTLRNWSRESRLREWALKYHGVVITVWYALVAAAVLEAFWFYWRTLL